MTEPQGHAERPPPGAGERSEAGRLDAIIRLSLIALLAVWCVSILRPFLIPLVWGVILAIGLHPLFLRICERLAGRRVIAAAVVSGLMLLGILAPALVLSGSVVADAQLLVRAFEAGRIEIPPPPAAVSGLPMIGDTVGGIWQQASENLEAALGRLQPELVTGFKWFVGVAAGAGIGFVEFLVAILLAGVFLARAEIGQRKVRALARRLAGDRGMEVLTLAAGTVRSVIRGILGVALIQAILAGIGWLLAGVPAAGLWALLALVLSAVQIGILPLSLGVLAYVYLQGDVTTFVLLLIWSLLVGALEHVLKPLLLGRGVDVPMSVVFLGAIGGLITTGVIGLFIGAVVLVAGYRLFDAWLEDGADSETGMPVAGTTDAVGRAASDPPPGGGGRQP